MEQPDAPPPAPPQDPPPQNLALIKLVTAFLGLLLVGGVALLCVLLVLRDDDADDVQSATSTVATGPAPTLTIAPLPGEVLEEASAAPRGVLLRFRSEERDRLVLVGEDGSVRQEITVPTR